MVRFVEQNFGIAEGALGYADQRATTDLTDMFNLHLLPRPFVTITAPEFVHTCTECDPDND